MLKKKTTSKCTIEAKGILLSVNPDNASIELEDLKSEEVSNISLNELFDDFIGEEITVVISKSRKDEVIVSGSEDE